MPWSSPRRWLAVVCLLDLASSCGGGSGAASTSGDAGAMDGPAADRPVHACRPVPQELGNWQPAGPAGPHAFGYISVSPDGRTLFGVDGAGLFRSDDEGRTWCLVPSPPRPREVFFSSAPDRTLYLTISPPPEVTPADPEPREPVYRSDDGGDTWIGPGTDTLPTYALALYPASANPREMFAVAGSPPQRLWATHDGGDHWAEVLDPTAAPGGWWSWMARHPLRQQEIYALIGHEPTPPTEDMLWMSRDEGRTWTEVMATRGTSLRTPMFQADGSLLAIDVTGQLHVLGVDGSWKPLGVPASPEAQFILGTSINPPALLVGTGNQRDPFRAWKSQDGGSTWKQVFSHPAVGVSVMLLGTGHLLERSPDGLRLSTDDGQSWETLQTFVSGNRLLSTAAGGGAIFLTATSTISRSDDQGANWTTTPFFDRSLTRLILDPIVPDSYYAIAYPRSGGARRIARSRDAGKSWTDLPSPAINVPSVPGPASVDFAALGTSPPTLLVAKADAVLRSEDDGQTWTATGAWPLSNQLPLDTNFDAFLQPAPSAPDKVYAVIRSIVHRSVDAGRNWEKVMETAVSALIVDPSDPDTFYYRTRSRSELFKFSGGASRMVPIAGGIVLTPARPGTIFLITAKGEVARTSDEGQTVTLLDVPGPATSLMFDPKQRDLLYAIIRGQVVKRKVD